MPGPKTDSGVAPLPAMSTTTHSFDVSTQEFAQRVLARSHEVPILVDFWAAWCAPCQMLAPVLARVVQDYQGRVLLAKVDTDVEQELARRYGVRGLPTVKLFRNGAPVDEFVGLQPEPAIRRLLERHVPSRLGELIALARERYANDPGQALGLLTEALALEPGSDAVKTELAWMHMLAGNTDEAQRWLEELSAPARLTVAARAIDGQIRFARLRAGAPSRQELEQALARNADDCRARELLAACAVTEQDYESALQQLLEIVKRDRRYGDDAGRKHMLAVFDLLGGKGELVNRYRHLLSIAIN